MGLDALAFVTGCASTTALDRAVLTYARAPATPSRSNSEPMHFTTISSIAATYEFTLNGGFGPAPAGPRGGTIAPVCGASAEEHEVLNFIGRGTDEAREFDVPHDPRTPAITENPVSALAIVESSGAPKDADFVVDWRGVHYTVAPDAGYAWNRKAFTLLYQLFQMSLSTAQPSRPAITIAKRTERRAAPIIPAEAGIRRRSSPPPASPTPSGSRGTSSRSRETFPASKDP